MFVEEKSSLADVYGKKTTFMCSVGAPITTTGKEVSAEIVLDLCRLQCTRTGERPYLKETVTVALFAHTEDLA